MSNRELIEKLEDVLTNHRYEAIWTGCDGFSQGEIETMEETIEVLKSQEWQKPETLDVAELGQRAEIVVEVTWDSIDSVTAWCKDGQILTGLYDANRWRPLPADSEGEGNE